MELGQLSNSRTPTRARTHTHTRERLGSPGLKGLRHRIIIHFNPLYWLCMLLYFDLDCWFLLCLARHPANCSGYSRMFSSAAPNTGGGATWFNWFRTFWPCLPVAVHVLLFATVASQTHQLQRRRSLPECTPVRNTESDPRCVLVGSKLAGQLTAKCWLGSGFQITNNAYY